MIEGLLYVHYNGGFATRVIININIIGFWILCMAKLFIRIIYLLSLNLYFRIIFKNKPNSLTNSISKSIYSSIWLTLPLNHLPLNFNQNLYRPLWSRVSSKPWKYGIFAKNEERILRGSSDVLFVVFNQSEILEIHWFVSLSLSLTLSLTLSLSLSNLISIKLPSLPNS